ncbi:tRNA (cytidine(56)-2'-O)-methyltransferase [Halobacteriaceae bacterium SHR40]|uniref:tRNA (cytidine(56)-2'-O)-methyltransferase n=1 Tax=Halovenus amylolytica TaxID=2500550 RepID=UPI000FE3BEF6
MQEDSEVAVVRLGHRPGRDERMTTHVGLTARALGADRAIIANATQSCETVRDITDRFGGPFEVEETSDPLEIIDGWEGPIVHLTMYGLPIQDVEGEIRKRHHDGESLLVVVGAEKVPFDVYEAAEYNVGVTNQPHSEVASLAIFLDHLFEGDELDQEWDDADSVVVPKETGKLVEDR